MTECLPDCSIGHGRNNDCGIDINVIDDESRMGTSDPGIVATLELRAGGPCSQSGSIQLNFGFLITTTGDDEASDDVERLTTVVWPQVVAGLTKLQPVLADWVQRSKCQHPENEPCP